MPHNGSSERPSLPPDTLYWCDEKKEGERERARERARERKREEENAVSIWHYSVQLYQHLALHCAAVLEVALLVVVLYMISRSMAERASGGVQHVSICTLVLVQQVSTAVLVKQEFLMA